MSSEEPGTRNSFGNTAICLECENYNNERGMLEQTIREEIGGEEWENRKQEEDSGITTVLGFKETNNNIMKGTKTYLNKTWRKRKENRDRNRLEINPIIREHNYI